MYICRDYTRTHNIYADLSYCIRFNWSVFKIIIIYILFWYNNSKIMYTQLCEDTYEIEEKIPLPLPVICGLTWIHPVYLTSPYQKNKSVLNILRNLLDALWVYIITTVIFRRETIPFTILLRIESKRHSYAIILCTKVCNNTHVCCIKL